MEAAEKIREYAEHRARERWPDDTQRQMAMVAGRLIQVIYTMEYRDETPRQFAERVGLIGGGE